MKFSRLTVDGNLIRVLTSLWLIMVVAAGLRFGYAWYQQRTVPTEILRGRLQQETGNIAYSLATGRGFSSPWRRPSGPTAYLAPAYPVLLAGIYKIFGVETLRSFFVAASLNILFSVAACVPIFCTGKRIAGAAVGSTAAWFWALLPNAVVLPVNWIWDAALSALLAAGLLWATLWVAGSPRPRNWCTYGLLWGFALLTNPVFISLLPFLIGWAACRSTSSALLRLRRVSIAAGCAVLCCLPWTVRNYVAFHKFIPMRSALGFALYLQNNENYDEHPRPWPYNVTREREFYRFFRIGEPAFMDEEMHKALSFMVSHPRTELRLCAYRFLSFWTGSPQPLHDFRAADSFFFASCVHLRFSYRAGNGGRARDSLPQARWIFLSGRIISGDLSVDLLCDEWPAPVSPSAGPRFDCALRGFPLAASETQAGRTFVCRHFCHGLNMPVSAQLSAGAAVDSPPFCQELSGLVFYI